MKKRNKTYRQRPRHAPTMVVMHTVPELGITERTSIEAFRGGWAQSDHFDNLADCRDILTMAANERNDSEVLTVCELAYVAMISIKDRHTNTGKFGATGEEIKALIALADTSEDFWKRQAGSVFNRHYTQLVRARELQKAGQL